MVLIVKNNKGFSNMKNIIDALKNSRLVQLVTLLVVVSPINIFPMRMTEQGKDLAQRHLARQQELMMKKWKQQEELKETRELLIFLDDLEKKPGAVGHTFVTGLYEEICPIIASTLLLYNLCEERKKDTRPIETLLNELKDIRHNLEYKTKNIINDFHEKNEIAVSRIGFRQERWIIKKIDDSLLLLIPKTYLELFDIDDNKVQEYYKDLELLFESEVELKLGLRVNHMKTITIEEIFKPIEPQFVDYFTNSMDSVFCTKTDYNIANQNRPEWVIYIDGHGSVNGNIVGLSLKGFQEFLSFLENKIKTQLLIVVSCYAIGVNSDKIFGNMKTEVKNQYSFPIIVQGVRDTSVANLSPGVLKSWIEKQKIGLDTEINFSNFLKIAEQIKEGNYDKIMNIRGSIQNIPQIKLPGIEWFSVRIANEEIVSIGPILVKTRDPQKSLDVISFFKKDPKIILLYTDNIPFELIINSNKLKAISSMMSAGPVSDIPEFVIHRIKKITSSQEFLEILRWFESVANSQGSKAFFVDEIGKNKDVFISGSATDSMQVYFKEKDKDDILWKTELQYGKGQVTIEEVKPNSEYEKFYQSRVSMMREKYPIYLRKQRETNQEITSEQIKVIEGVLKVKK